jgi:uncharacterized protein (TIGR02594 family)
MTALRHCQFNAKIIYNGQKFDNVILSVGPINVSYSVRSTTRQETRKEQGMGIHTVRTGDTLGRIGRRYGLSLDDLLKINPQIDNPDLIHPGQAINISAAEETGAVVNTTDNHDLFPGGEAPWFEIAKREEAEGVDEIRGSRDNPRIVEYHQSTTLKATDDETPWCSSFVNWCVQEAGLQGTRSASARSWLRWGQDLHGEPRLGCIVVLKRGTNPAQGHVGFYFGDAGDRLLLLGGNQNNQVNISSFRKTSVLSYRWPSET